MVPVDGNPSNVQRPHILSMATHIIPAPTIGTSIEDAVKNALDTPWNVILHNDNTSAIDEVMFALMEVIQISQEAAVKLVVNIHHSGKGIVASTTFEKAEFYQDRLSTDFKLTVTLEKSE